jgi:hypothetical protein
MVWCGGGGGGGGGGGMCVCVCVCVYVLETRVCVQKAKCILTHNRITYFTNMNLKRLNSQQS